MEGLQNANTSKEEINQQEITNNGPYNKKVNDQAYKLIVNYLDNEVYRKSFNELAKNTFGLDFEPWYTKGYLRGNYIPYAWVKDEQVVCNASLNFFTFLVKGEVKKGIQLGTVMTHPEFRKQGLALQLITKIVEDYHEEQDVIYLFANDSVLDFYPKAGFLRKPTTVFEVEAKQIQRKKGNLRKLSIQNQSDYNSSVTLSNQRVPLSQRLGIFQDVWPLQVYLTEMLSENLYYIEELEVIVVMKREEGKLELMDVVSVVPVKVEEILAYITQESDEMVEIQFVVGELVYSVVQREIWDNEDALFFYQGKELEEPIAFPLTSHT